MFTEDDRLVYRCPATKRYYDPLALRRGFLLAREYNAAAQGMRSDDACVAAEAEGVVVAVGRKIFGLKPIDPITGEGVTDSLVVEAVTAYTGWLRGKSETAQSSGPSAPCTDCP